MSKLLNVELKLDGRQISGKILHQDRSLRYNNEKDIDFKQGDYVIKSQAYPQLDKNILFIRGTLGDADEKPFRYTYQSENQAFIAYNTFKDIIYEINNK